MTEERVGGGDVVEGAGARREYDVSANGSLIVGLGIGLGVAGCQGGFLGLGNDRESNFRPDRAVYTMQPTALGLEVSIGYTYQNRTGRHVHILNCNGFAPPHLEKRVGDEWVFAWAAATPDCISLPIPIPYLGTYASDIPVFHGAGEIHPKFEVTPLDGTYRLVWDAIRWNNDGTLYSIGDTLPLQLRVSSSFQIVTPG